ncbi:MAG: hypothetical protein ACRC50_12090 [Gaiella sp.]
MPTYILEAYVADGAAARGEITEQATAVARLGTGVRYVRTTFLPDDQVVLLVFEAPSAGALRRAGDRAGLRFERLVEAYEDGTPGASSDDEQGGTPCG